MSVAYVLSGGGAKGSYQCGAMSVLHEYGVRPDAIYGTSIGAVNAFTYAFAGMAELRRQWEQVRRRQDFLSTEWWQLLFRRSRGIYKMDPLRKRLASLQQEKAFCEAVSCFGDMKDGSINYAYLSKTPSDLFLDYTLASAAIPFIMEPVQGRFVDGGVREMIPFQRALEDGHDEIYVMLCNPRDTNMSMEWEGKHEIDFALRALDVLQFDVYMNDLAVIQDHIDKGRVKITVIAPDRVWLDTLEFGNDKIMAAVHAGERDARAIMEAKRAGAL